MEHSSLESCFWAMPAESPWSGILFSPRSQTVHLIARYEVYNPTAYIIWAVEIVVGLPIYACMMGLLLVIDTIAVAVEFIYTTLKRWNVRMMGGITVDRVDLVSDQLPTTNNFFADSTSKTSSRLSSAFIPDLDHILVSSTVLDETKLPLCKIPPTSLTCIYDDPNPALPQPCAQPGGRIRKSDSQFHPGPPPPYH